MLSPLPEHASVFLPATPTHLGLHLESQGHPLLCDKPEGSHPVSLMGHIYTSWHTVGAQTFA